MITKKELQYIMNNKKKANPYEIEAILDDITNQAKKEAKRGESNVLFEILKTFHDDSHKEIIKNLELWGLRVSSIDCISSYNSVWYEASWK